MAEYRCYHIDLRGHIVAFEVFHRANDSEAIGHARRIASEAGPETKREPEIRIGVVDT
jgi:hypothetical protein